MAITDVQHRVGAPAQGLSTGGAVQSGLPRALADAAPAVALLGAILSVVAVAVAAAGAPADAAFGRGLLELLIVGVPIASGVYALRSPVSAGFGIALLAIGFAWSLTALGQSSQSVPYTIGRLSNWLVFPGVAYLLLAFPDGRVDSRLDRALMVLMLFITVVLFYGTAPIVHDYPPHTLWATCTTDCPANAVALVDHPPAFLPKLILVREWMVELLWVGLFVSMYRRWREASPLRRRSMAPVFAVAVALGLCHCAFHTSRQLGAPAQTVVTLSEIWTFCIVALCATFLFALFWRRLLLTGALARLGVALSGSDNPAAVRDALGRALGDSEVELAFRDQSSGVWRDASGQEVSWPRTPPPGHAATTIDGPGEVPDVVLIHDVALRDDPELLDGVSGMVAAGWRHERLMSDLAAAMNDLEESRHRIAEAADLERARIERDLHDGTQQRLVGLRMKLAIAEETLRADPAAGVEQVHALGFEAERALDELRSLSHGVYPSTLTNAGVPGALQSLALESPIPVHIAATGLTRHPIEVESAVYFTCAEAIQNVLKHGTGATGVWIRLTQSSKTLRFEVRDDGRGFTDNAGDGRGLRNMHDRIEAIGGHLSIEARPRRGTVVTGSVELR